MGDSIFSGGSPFFWHANCPTLVFGRFIYSAIAGCCIRRVPQYGKGGYPPPTHQAPGVLFSGWLSGGFFPFWPSFKSPRPSWWAVHRVFLPYLTGRGLSSKKLRFFSHFFPWWWLGCFPPLPEAGKPIEDHICRWEDRFATVVSFSPWLSLVVFLPTTPLLWPGQPRIQPINPGWGEFSPF